MMLSRRLAVVLALFTWLVLIPAAHGVVPWALSTLTRHYGWHDATPGVLNWLGLAPAAAGAALLGWILVSGLAQMPERVRLGLTPSFLLLRGPYKITRNPMYVAELALWFGWAVFFGSPIVLIVCLLFWSILSFAIVPLEERGLEAAFGASYVEYKGRVPRWLGKPKPAN